MVILGLDSSTSVTGWAFSKDSKVLDAGYIDTKKFETTKEKTSRYCPFNITVPWLTGSKHGDSLLETKRRAGRLCATKSC